MPTLLKITQSFLRHFRYKTLIINKEIGSFYLRVNEKHESFKVKSRLKITFETASCIYIN